MDEFGTGYSSLSSLKQFPLHELKIGRSFLKDIASNSEDQALVAMMIYSAHEFELKVVAEGGRDRSNAKFLSVWIAKNIRGISLVDRLACQTSLLYLLT